MIKKLNTRSKRNLLGKIIIKQSIFNTLLSILKFKNMPHSNLEFQSDKISKCNTFNNLHTQKNE